VHFGPPTTFGHLRDQERSSRVLREVTDRIRTEIERLSGQEFVDAYATSVKTAE
jgi:1-acyl-sn-glycerol-3-phosphate acyltransferase